VTVVGRGCVNCRWWGHGSEPIVGFRKGDKRHCGMYVYGKNSESNQAYLESGDFASSEGSLWTDANFVCSMWEKQS